MALKDQPYLPLYVDDFLADEKLSLCSAEATGVYIRLMCLMHKSDEYGVILLKQRFKQNTKQVLNFASMLAKQLPYSQEVIVDSLEELLEEEVLSVDGDKLFQKRMVKDGKLSNIRALAGSKGGKNTHSNKKSTEIFAGEFAQAKTQANTVIGIGNGNYSSIDKEETGDTGVQGEKNQRAELSRVMTLYLDRINPAPSSFCIDLLKSYTDDMGADVVCRAINMAIDNRALNWNYIKAILQRWTADGVKNAEDVDRLEGKAGKRKDDTQGGFHYDPGPMEGSL